ncbi:MAG: hypothetical protein PHX83_04160 [Acidobacteriia bacterium]|nr:hypothetical protein [Terriglobia bacterium]
MTKRITVLTTLLWLAAAVALPGAGQEHHTFKGLDLKVTGLEFHPRWTPPSISGVALTGKGVSEIAVVHLEITQWVGAEITKSSDVSFEITLLDGTKVPCALGGWESRYEIGPNGERKPLPPLKPSEVPLGFVFGKNSSGAEKWDKLEVPFVVPKGTTRVAAFSIGSVTLDLKNFEGTRQ